jgi:Domain of unknown function (DUF1906)
MPAAPAPCMRTQSYLSISPLRVASLLALSGVAGCSGAAPSDVSSSSSAVTVAVLRGVDSASPFGGSEAAALKSDYGIAWTGVYIGGPCNGGSGWSRADVDSIYSATGWQFLPIWVGQNSSTVCGASNMTEGQGEADGAQTASDMAAWGWGANKNIPVMLDLESETYGGDPDGSLDYVRGWASKVRSSGYLAYVYSSPDGIDGIASDGIELDGVMVAAWLWNDGEGQFESLSPYDGATGLGNNYDSENRAWQYCGDIEAAGMHVDCDVSDLVLAPAPGGSNGSGPTPGNASCKLAGKSWPTNTCTETLQCDDGSWVSRSSDASDCNTGILSAGACLNDSGGTDSQNTCTSTLQCDDGVWVDRTDDPSACNGSGGGGGGAGSCSLGGHTYSQNTCTETLQCDRGSWVDRNGDPSSCLSGIEANGACITDSGQVDAQNTCTSSQQCDDGVWVDRFDDPTSCR